MINERTFHPHQAHKLEDPDRLTWLPPGGVVEALGLRPGQRIADIGAGTGYFALPFAKAVAPGGEVAAVDLQPEMLSLLRAKLHGPEQAVISLVEGTALATTLDSGRYELVFYGNVWHELDDLPAVIAEARRLLRPGGRVAVLDWRPDVEHPPGPPPAHRVTDQAVVAALGAQGFTATATPFGRYSYLVIAR